MNDFRSSFEAVLLDLDGTLFHGVIPVPGLKRFFDQLNEMQLIYLILTNNATRSPRQYQSQLAREGVTIPQKAILTAGEATADYLEQLLPKGSPLYVIGEKPLRDSLRKRGFDLLGLAAKGAAAVVVGGDSKLTYQKIKQACLLLQRGARLIGTNPDLVYPTEEGLVPEAGTTLAALKAASGIEPLIVGKPETIIFDMALKRIRTNPGRTAIVGDRLETDILGGLQAGLHPILITSGVDQREAIIEKGIQPAAVVDNLDALAELLRKQAIGE